MPTSTVTSTPASTRAGLTSTPTTTPEGLTSTHASTRARFTTTPNPGPWTPPDNVLAALARVSEVPDGYVSLTVYRRDGVERPRCRDDFADLGEPVAWLVSEVRDLLDEHPGAYTHARVRVWRAGGRNVSGAKFRLPDPSVFEAPLHRPVTASSTAPERADRRPPLVRRLAGALDLRGEGPDLVRENQQLRATVARLRLDLDELRNVAERRRRGLVQAADEAAVLRRRVAALEREHDRAVDRLNALCANLEDA